MFQGGDPESSLNKEYKLNLYSGGKTFTIKIVGIKGLEGMSGYESPEIYLSDGLMEDIKAATYRNYSDTKVTINDPVYDGKYEYPVTPNKNVPRGEAYVSQDMSYLFKNGSSLNQKIRIAVDNIYFASSMTPTVTERFNNNNLLRLTGFSKYEEHSMEIFVNPTDYAKLYKQGNFQISVYVSDSKAIDKTALKIQELGFEPLVLKNYLQDYGGEEISRIVQIPLLIIFVVGIFFVAYFVTRLILKSRGVYFTILRILGLDKENTKRILDIELFTVVTISYGLVLGFFTLVSQQIIKIEYDRSLIQYLTVGDYILLYAVLLFMAFLLSRRFARRLFKKSAMVTFREEA
jgi:hypothetical protein